MRQKGVIALGIPFLFLLIAAVVAFFIFSQNKTNPLSTLIKKRTYGYAAKSISKSF